MEVEANHSYNRGVALSSIISEHVNKKFEINRTKIKGGCQLGRKVLTHNSKSNLPLDSCELSTIFLRKSEQKQIIFNACNRNIYIYFVSVESPTHV